jgi:hypothetical protein
VPWEGRRLFTASVAVIFAYKLSGEALDKWYTRGMPESGQLQHPSPLEVEANLLLGESTTSTVVQETEAADPSSLRRVLRLYTEELRKQQANQGKRQEL